MAKIETQHPKDIVPGLRVTGEVADTPDSPESRTAATHQAGGARVRRALTAGVRR